MKILYTIIIIFLFLSAPHSENIIDTEVHLFNFNQKTEGINSLIKSMNRANVDSVVIMGMPLQKIWGEHDTLYPETFESNNSKLYYYSLTDVLLAEQILKLPKNQQNRFRPLICGFNPTDKNAVKHIERMLDLYPNFWSGIGEILTRHDILTSMTYGQSARANHPALMKVYKLAAEKNLTVALHSNITSLRDERLIYLDELIEAISENPKTTFVWAHAGTSANIERRQHIKNLDKVIEKLLKKYPNLNILISWTLTDYYIFDKNEKPKKEWIDLVNRYPDRFIIGSDVVGKFTKLDEALKLERKFIKSLKKDVAEKVSRLNAERLFPKK
jgi:hypothetical protein